MTDNYIYRFLNLTEQEYLAKEFDLMPFEITTQTIERTLIDKVFAICDYYLLGKTDRHSRHLYDIYKILNHVPSDSSLSQLFQEVRQLREPLPICPSAKYDIQIYDILSEIIEKKAYEDDYNRITEKLLFTYIPYKTAIRGIKKIIDHGYFT